MIKETKLVLLSEPSRRTREEFGPLPVAHDRITTIYAGDVPLPVRTAVGAISLNLPDTLASRLIGYKERYFTVTDKLTGTINCAHFVHFMKGTPNEDIIESMRSLDKITGSALESDRLPFGHIGIIASSENLNDPTDFNHFLHAGVSIGDGRWLNVTGHNADLAVSSIADDISYYRESVRKWYGDAYRPELVHLYDSGFCN